jgi:hypothetical protein
MILYKKLQEIDKNKKRKNLNNLATTYNFKKKKIYKEIYIQNGIKALAQENLFMLKRLLERASNINNRKLKQDFEKNQEYKHNICFYPSINFLSKNKVNEPIIESFNTTKDKFKSSLSNFPGITKYSSLHFRKTFFNNHILDSQFYKNAIRTKKYSPDRTTRVKTEEESKSGMDDIGSGNTFDKGTGSGSLAGTRDKSEIKEKKKKGTKN